MSEIRLIFSFHNVFYFVYCPNIAASLSVFSTTVQYNSFSNSTTIFSHLSFQLFSFPLCPSCFSCFRPGFNCARHGRSDRCLMYPKFCFDFYMFVSPYHIVGALCYFCGLCRLAPSLILNISVFLPH